VNTWTDAAAPRIWRASEMHFCGDEPLQALDVYTEDRLRRIAEQGFNAVWLRGKLRDLVRTDVLSDLARPDTERRIEALGELIARGRRCGVAVYLYFNEPLAVRPGEPFWKTHAELAGRRAFDANSDLQCDVVCLCTSTETVQQYMREATRRLLEQLPHLGGVILITASEYWTHCWSRVSLRGPGGYVPAAEAAENVQCPRCARREPADLVADLVGCWAAAAAQVKPRPRVIAWNWSWSMWYGEPQREILQRLPDGAEILAGWERGGHTRRCGKDVLIDEYSLGYVGPSERFVRTRRIAGGRGLAVHAKLQIGTTHEIATVPNLPLMANLYRKLRGLASQHVAGVMACWSVGCRFTLNTAAMRHFLDHPDAAEDLFLKELCRSYFGQADAAAVARAWRAFCDAFGKYPFANKVIYRLPINYAPAFPLVARFRGAQMGRSWHEHEWGDAFDDQYESYTLAEVLAGFEAMIPHWDRGLADYAAALEAGAPDDDVQRRHRAEELSCARMIRCHLQGMVNILRFDRWRRGVLAARNLTPPCDVPLDEEGRRLIAAQLENARTALALAEADGRLGWHEEAKVFFCGPQQLTAAIGAMETALA